MFENIYNTIKEAKVCPICSRPFTAHPTKRYCSRRCKNKAKNTRTKINELAPQISTIHQVELFAPTITEMDLLCKQVLIRSDDTIYKIKVIPTGWTCPPDLTCIHHVSESNKAKNYYELFIGTSGFITVQEDISPERAREWERKLEEAARHKFEQDKIARRAVVEATKISPKEELATVEVFGGPHKENLTMIELDQFCAENFYNKKGTEQDKLVNDLGEEVGKITYS